MSDLHFEVLPENYGIPFDVPSGDVLILAGDIINGKLHGLEELETLCSNFNNVVMVMGNHEHYKGRFDKTYSVLKGRLPSNVTLLENDIVTIDGQRFVGCTAWSYMSDVDRYFAKLKMNDYRVIKNKYNDIYRKLIPEDTVQVHLKSALWLERNIKEGDVVITHHAPSFKSCNPDYDGNTAYATDLSDMILDNNPSTWIHGHIHDSQDYMIGDTRVLCNPHGYGGMSGAEINPSFNPDLTFEI